MFHLIQGSAWTEQRRFILKGLKDQGFGKASMEESILEEVTKFCDKLRDCQDQPVDLVSFEAYIYELADLV